MLQAVSEMLGYKETDNALNFKTQVTCAKTVLDKVIEGLPSDNPSVVFAPGSHPDVHEVVDSELPLAEEPKKKKEVIPAGKYKIVKDANNKIVRIDGLPLDGKVELDGKVMTHAEAKGKSFISGRIL